MQCSDRYFWKKWWIKRDAEKQIRWVLSFGRCDGDKVDYNYTIVESAPILTLVGTHLGARREKARRRNQGDDQAALQLGHYRKAGDRNERADMMSLIWRRPVTISSLFPTFEESK